MLSRRRGRATASRRPGLLLTWSALALLALPTPDPGVGAATARVFSAAEVDSIGRSIADGNDRTWSETDSLYRAGWFGAPGTPAARHGARVHYHLRVRTGMECITEMTRCAGHGITIDGTALERPFGRQYANYGIYPVYFLESGLIGAGRFRLDYLYPAAFFGELLLGGEPFPVSVEPVQASDRRPSPALTVTMPTALNKSVSLVFDARVLGRAREETIIDRGDTLTLRILDELEGMYVRRAGLHPIGAIMTWRNVTHGRSAPLHPRLGASVYLPRLALRLPGPIPDLRLHDLRDMDYPMPIVRSEWFDQAALSPPEWLTVRADGTMSPWDAVGPQPRILEEWFPDL